MESVPTVFVVDDDEAVRRQLQWLLESVGLSAESFGSAQGFQEACDPTRPGCLILDVRMPEMSGLDLQERLVAQGSGLPVIFVTGYGDVRTAVRAMKAGALDFIEKPFNDQELLDRIHQAIEQDARARQRQAQGADIAARLASLTVRECEVLDLVVAGEVNKAIALALGLSHKTVEFHRRKIMDKMQARNVIDLVRMVLEANRR
ncbi:MAG: response regulator transcription factor [Phycisphaerae bacterium]|nr:response regulator transcription factor [Phycisphaerae bacterium]